MPYIVIGRFWWEVKFGCYNIANAFLRAAVMDAGRSELWDVLNDLDLQIQKINEITTLFDVASCSVGNKEAASDCMDCAIELHRRLVPEAADLVKKAFEVMKGWR